MTEPASQRESVADRIRREDARVPYVERALLAAQLGTTLDDLLLLGDDVVTSLLDRPSAVVQTIGASRLLERIDAHVAREHPVDLERHGPITTASVPVGDDDATRVVLERGTVFIDSLELSADDAEALAHALLRLVALARAEARLNQPEAT